MFRNRSVSSLSSSSSTLRSKSPSTTRKGFCKVMVRLRTLESEDDEQIVWEHSKPGLLYLHSAYTKYIHETFQSFEFDWVHYGSDNRDLYNSTTRKLVWEYAMKGVNATVFAYGQTASGKTYSMMGIDDQPGIIPQAVDDVFAFIREDEDREYLLRVCYLEIYNEQIKDLLCPATKDIRIHEDKKRGIFLSPLREEIVTTPKQVMRIINKGEANRAYGSTDYNENSSRSHSIFQIIIESRDANRSSKAVTISYLNLIDLAGSEKFSNNLERRKEGSFINKSLLTLGNVISKLTENQGNHIPYRESKLTRILQNSLSGNSKIAVICTITPNQKSLDESINTLKFACKLKKVSTHTASKNTHHDDKALLQKYKREIELLRAKIEESHNDEAKMEQYENELHESRLARVALKERINHLTRLILTSSTITKNVILNWDIDPEEASLSTNKRASVMMQGLLPSSSAPTSALSINKMRSSSFLETRVTQHQHHPVPLETINETASFYQKHINEIAIRDQKIQNLESLVASIKGKDVHIDSLISKYENDNDCTIENSRIEELERENRNYKQQVMQLRLKVRQLEIGEFESQESVSAQSASSSNPIPDLPSPIPSPRIPSVSLSNIEHGKGSNNLLTVPKIPPKGL